MNAGERMKELRKYLSMSQDELGLRIGIKKSAISRVENGNNSPTEQTILAICREFGVSYDWIKFGDGEMFHTSVIEQDMLLFHNLMNSGDEVAKALFRAYAKKFDGRWHLVREFLEGVLADAAEQEKGAKKDEP